MTATRTIPWGLLAALMITLLRILVIDIDPPVRDLTDYLAKDECFYVFPAYDLHETGEAFRDVAPRWYGLPVVNNVLAYVGLSLFGDNYLGLRIGSIVLALFSLLLFHRILAAITSDRWLLHLLPLTMACDLSFGYASIFVEPTGSRMTMMLLLMAMAVRPGALRGWRAPLLAAVATLISLPTYPTNAFVIMGVVVAALGVEWGTSRSLAKLFVVGGKLAGAVLVALAVLIGLTAWAGFKDLDAFLAANDAYKARVGIAPAGWLNNLLHIPYANIFRLDPMLLLLALGAGGVLLWRIRRTWSVPAVVIMSFTTCLLAQTVFINDYPRRKLVILLPLVLLLIALARENARTVKGSKVRPLAFWMFAGLAWLATVWQSWVHVKTSAQEPAGVMRALWPGLIVFGVFSLMLLIHLLRSRNTPLHPWYLVLLLVPGLVNSVDGMVLHRHHAYRDMLTELRSYSDAHFIGAASMGFRPYNDLRVSLNPYIAEGAYDGSWKIMAEMAAQDTSVNYCIGYLDQAADLARIGFRPVRVFLLEPSETWRERQFIVYREQRPADDRP